MKILVSGYYGFGNLGDEAILKSIIMALKNVDSNIDITVLSNDIENTEKVHKVKAINRWNPFVIFSKLISSDGLISGGGSLFQDITSSRTILYYSFIIGLAKLARKPVFIYAQGIGPISKKLNRKIIKYLFNKVDYITLRDVYSKKLIESIGVKNNITIVPDPVMAFDVNNIDDNLPYEYKTKNYITISIRNWKSNNHMFFSNLAKACDKIIDSGIEVVFVPMHGEDDEKISKYVSSKMKNNSNIISKDLSIEERVAYIKNSKVLIGMRLHSLIFAATVGVPMIGISYDPKIDSYLNLVKQPSLGSVDEFLNDEDLVKLVFDIMDNYESSKLSIEEESYKLKELASFTAELAIENFKENN